MSIAVDEFVKQLEDSGIVESARLEGFIPPNAHPKDAEELARELINQNVLTKFQAQQVLAGRAKALFLGNYTILEKIGAGGMGQVFKAEHRRMRRTVALKMLPTAVIKDALAIARFQREVEAASKLLHPNIVSAFDADESDGVHFLVMEFVDGSDLSALVKKNGPLSVASAVEYTLQAARGLEFAHAERVIHRDIKPANLLVDKKGMIKILDMGLARIDATGDAATQAELTGTGAIMGTVDYMAPEQALSTRSADARADIYSLGCSLYYLLSGKPMYDGETVTAKLLAHQGQRIPSLHDINPEVPATLEAVFHKMVAKQVAERYQTMGEVAAGLEHARAELPGGAARSATTILGQNAADQRAPPRKNSALMIGAGAGAFLLILLGVIVIVRNEHGDEVARIESHTGKSVEVQTTTTNPAASTSKVTRAAPQPLAAPFDSQQARAGQEAWAKHLGTSLEQNNPVGMPLVLIPPGEFQMGSTPAQIAAAHKMAETTSISHPTYERFDEEAPQHRVVLTAPYWIGRTEVTIGQFRKFVDATKYVTEIEKAGGGFVRKDHKSDKEIYDPQRNWRTPGYEVSDDSALTLVSWGDAVRFCNWLSAQENLRPAYQSDGKEDWKLTGGGGYRLPTEAEWEYACRAGTTTHFSFGDDPAQLATYGWFVKNSDSRANEVARKLPNPFRLFDMHGNVWEWCHDWNAPDYYAHSPAVNPLGPAPSENRVCRGGYFNAASPALCRSAFRMRSWTVTRFHHFGFRVARTATK